MVQLYLNSSLPARAVFLLLLWVPVRWVVLPFFLLVLSSLHLRCLSTLFPLGWWCLPSSSVCVVVLSSLLFFWCGGRFFPLLFMFLSFSCSSFSISAWCYFLFLSISVLFCSLYFVAYNGVSVPCVLLFFLFFCAFFLIFSCSL